VDYTATFPAGAPGGGDLDVVADGTALRPAGASVSCTTLQRAVRSAVGTAAAPLRFAQQTLSVSPTAAAAAAGGAPAGSFTLSFAGAATAALPLAPGALTAAALHAALAALYTVRSVRVDAVAGGNAAGGADFEITFLAVSMAPASLAPGAASVPQAFPGPRAAPGATSMQPQVSGPLPLLAVAAAAAVNATVSVAHAVAGLAPFSLTVLPGKPVPLPGALGCGITASDAGVGAGGGGLSAATAGATAWFALTPRDGYGNAVAAADGAGAREVQFITITMPNGSAAAAAAAAGGAAPTLRVRAGTDAALARARAAAGDDSDGGGGGDGDVAADLPLFDASGELLSAATVQAAKMVEGAGIRRRSGSSPGRRGAGRW
jgi:hypothetical protein